MPAESRDRFAPCRVRDVVTIDNRGRVAWSREFGVLRSLSADRGMIVAAKVDESSARIAQLDGRRRLQLPFGVLAAAGMHQGDRVVIVELDDETVILAAPSAFAVSPKANERGD